MKDMKNMKKIYIILIPIILLIVCILIFTIFSKNKNDIYSTSITDINGNKDIVQYAIDMNNYSFSPSLIIAQPGKDLKIKITNKNGIHNFKIDKFNFDSGNLSAGESKIFIISIPSDASGLYEFYCSVGNHKEMGMIGKLEVKNT